MSDAYADAVRAARRATATGQRAADEASQRELDFLVGRIEADYRRAVRAGDVATAAILIAMLEASLLAWRTRTEAAIAAERARVAAEVRRIWSEAGGLGDPPDALVADPESAQVLRDTLARYGQVAGADLATITTHALSVGVPAVILGQMLRRYVVRGADFQDAFSAMPRYERLAALRATAPAALVDGARRVVTNLKRVVIDQVNDARLAAENVVMRVDPAIEAVRWVLSPYRGSQTAPDSCDELANGDFHGMGPGVYPLNAVPRRPHTHCRCERLAVTRPAARQDEPKPSPARQMDPADAVTAGGRYNTTARRERVRQELAGALRR